MRAYHTGFSILAALILLPLSRPAAAAGGYQAPPVVVVPPPADLAQIPITAGAPVSAPGEIWDKIGQDLVARDVTTPSITPFLPAPGTGNGAAVVIAPGGGFKVLSIRNEGVLVARWLAAHGVAAFVLKYRLDPTPVNSAAFQQQMAAMLSGPVKTSGGRPISTPGEALAQQDGLAAIRLVRSDATKYHIDPQRIGFIGFSAGAMTAMNVATAYDAASRPNFVASIYGAMPDRAVPVDAPPLFIAMAADDPLLPGASLPIFNAWHAAGKSAELHVFNAGGHGFGAESHGTTSDHWIEEFYWWLQANHFLAK